MTAEDVRDRIARGEICQHCRAEFMAHRIGNPRNEPAACADCEFLLRSPAEESHGSLTRCPDCGHVQAIESYLEEGERGVECEQCDAEYMVQVIVTLRYVSPARTARAT